MAAHYFNTVENNVTGKPVASAEVSVLTAPSASGGTEVTIYSDEALSVTIDNPITTDSKGFFEFYTSADSVCLEIAYGGTTQKVIDNVNLVGGTVSTDVTALQVRMDAAEAVTQDPMIVDIAALTDPGADRIAFWDESANEIAWLAPGTNVSISGTTLNVTASGATLADGDYGDISASSSGTVLTIDNDAVTYAKMQNVSAASKLLGRGDSGSGDVQEITLGTGLSMSGQTLSSSGSGNAWNLQWEPVHNEPPTSNFATLDTRNNRPVLDFDATTQEAAIFSGVLPADYGGAGITVSIYCAATSATTGTIGWLVSIERIDASSLDIDSDSFASAQTVTATTVPGTNGQILKLSVNISNGANMDSLAAGELFRLKVERDVTNDTATGDAELLRVMMVSQ